jgi:hypothetical protein
LLLAADGRLVYANEKTKELFAAGDILAAPRVGSECPTRDGIVSCAMLSTVLLSVAALYRAKYSRGKR